MIRSAAGSPLRQIVRMILNAIGLVLAAPWIAYAWVALHVFRSTGGYSAVSYLISLAPGMPGVLVRRAFYCTMLDRCHWDLTISFGSVLHDPYTRVGRRVWIGAYCVIGRCRLGDAVLIASRVSVLSGRYEHRFDSLDVPVRDQDGEVEPVEISDDCWLGEGSIVMADVGAHSVVGAGAVVVKPVGELLVVAGNPARQIGVRGHQSAATSY